MRLLLRCDASASGGAGHVVRSAAIGESARALGHEVLMVGDLGTVSWLPALLAELQVPVIDAPGWSRLASWAAAEGFEAVHVDDYLAPADLHGATSANGVVLSSIEDSAWGRRRADVVVDASLGSEERGRPDDGSPVTLLGPAYIPVRGEVRRGRTAAAARRDRAGGLAEAVREVLVLMGGTDASGALPQALAVLSQAQQRSGGPSMHVAAVGTAPPASELPGLELSPVPRGSGVVTAMARADLVVTAAGTTLGELCCLGVLTAAVPVVANQLEGYVEAVRRGVALGLGSGDEVGLSADAVVVLLAALQDPRLRRAVATRAGDLVDGQGAARIVRALENVAGAGRGRDPELTARPATTADAASLLTWRNGPEARSASRHQEVIARPAHDAWLAGVLASPDCHLFVVEDAAAQAIGSIRWDRDSADPTAWEVSILLAPHHIGRGLGRVVLTAGEHALATAEIQASTALASVHASNDASLRMFAAAGYAEVRGQDADGFVLLRASLSAAGPT